MGKENERISFVELDKIVPNPDQPRKDFDQESLQNLADSIREHGVLNAITLKGPLVAKDGHEFYQLVAGERRWRASIIAGKVTIPAVIRTTDSIGADLDMAITENLQREDMSPLEEGLAYRRLKEERGYTVERIGKLVNRSTATILARLKIAAFDPEIQKYFIKGGLASDWTTVNAIASLPDDQRVKIVSGLGARHASRSSVLRVCHMMSGKEENERAHRKVRQAASPIMSFTQPPEPKLYAMLKKKGGQVPNWEMVEKAAAKECGMCSMAATGSDSICADCPATGLIKKTVQLINEAEDEKTSKVEVVLEKGGE